MDTKAREQRAGKTINLLRQTLITATHFWQSKQAGDHSESHQYFHDDQGKDPSAHARAHVVADEQWEYGAKIDSGSRAGQVG